METRRIPPEEIPQLLREEMGRRRAHIDEEKGRFLFFDEGDLLAAEFVPPLTHPIPAGFTDPEAYLIGLGEVRDSYLAILFQAGAAALGCWKEGELLHHKAMKRYVVRGKGRSQITHLKTKGKSRYGSRLRLQNARLLFEEVREKVREWDENEGPFGRVFYSCPVRLRPMLFGKEADALFGPEVDLVKVPLDVRVPSHKELLHVHYEIRHGTLIRHIP